jgi:hypothetical protein
MKRTPLILTLVLALIGSGLRLWSLISATDQLGLPIGHPANYLLVGFSLVALLLFAWMAYRSPGRSGSYRVFAATGFPLWMLSAVLILVGAMVEFAQDLVAGPSILSPIILLGGLAGGFCAMGTAYFRRKGETHYPVTELFPVVYLILKLMCNFKSWSIDPIILDYCIPLFALIFTLLAFHRGAGFVFDQGKPRSALFYAMAAVYFCAAAVVDGIMDQNAATVVTYFGFLLWQLPVILQLLVPAKAVTLPKSKPQDPEPL